MEQSLNSGALKLPRARLAFARLLQIIGWPGLYGLALFVAASVVASDARLKQRELSGAQNLLRRPVPLAEPPAPGAPARELIKLSRREDIPLLLTRIERAATDNGLPWSSADYRIVPGTDHQAAALEVRCAFKAPYPGLRAMLSQVTGSLPAVTFREMTFSRPSIDSADVDAKFAIVVFLADEDPSPRLLPVAR